MTKEIPTKVEHKVQISFSIRLDNRIYFVLAENIAFIYLEKETVYLVDFNGDKHIIAKTVTSLESAVSPNQFYRINRQMIVNRKAIKEIESYCNQRIVVQLTVPTPEPAIVSRLKVTPFLNWVENGK